MVLKEFVHAGHVARFIITRAALGWDVREERDNAVVRTVQYGDWHRVERAMQAFERRFADADSRSSS